MIVPFLITNEWMCRIGYVLVGSLGHQGDDSNAEVMRYWAWTLLYRTPCGSTCSVTCSVVRLSGVSYSIHDPSEVASFVSLNSCIFDRHECPVPMSCWANRRPFVHST